ncbi:uncharacterized protein [Macrobrachium rosenbergii]|uniref:uncharacterized protein n=1 Tax=Macrobrachium rosenbergii TaxID=79674 RepID=UPI0034D6A949
MPLHPNHVALPKYTSPRAPRPYSSSPHAIAWSFEESPSPCRFTEALASHHVEELVLGNRKSSTDRLLHALGKSAKRDSISWKLLGLCLESPSFIPSRRNLLQDSNLLEFLFPVLISFM